MQNRTEILNEIKEISPVIAEIGYQNTLYEVPSGYFEDLPARVMNRVKAEHVKDELETLSPLVSQIDKQVFFSVPANYFETFAENVIGHIKALQADSATEELEILSPLLSQINKKSPFSTPAGYFTELPDSVLTGMKAIEFVNDELENLSPLMSSLKNKNLYEVPAKYFDSLPGNVLNQIKKQSQQAKIVSLGNRKTWLKYAAAAIVTGVLVTTGFLFFNNKKVNNSNTSGNLAKIEKQVADSLHNANDEDILNYLETQNTPLTETTNSIASADINENDAKDLLSDVSDDELQQYANEYTSSKDPVTN